MSLAGVLSLILATLLDSGVVVRLPAADACVVGRSFELILESHGREPPFPEAPFELDSLVVIAQRDDLGATRRRHYTVVPTLPGRIALPGFPLAAQPAAGVPRTDSFELDVRSAREPGSPEWDDRIALEEPEAKATHWLWWLVLAIVVGFATRQRLRRKATVVREEQTEDTALAALEAALRSMREVQPDLALERISAALRGALTAHTGIAIDRLTTEEVGDRLRGRGSAEPAGFVELVRVDPAVTDQATVVLVVADLWKYGGRQPAADVLETVSSAAESVLAHLRARTRV